MMKYILGLTSLWIGTIFCTIFPPLPIVINITTSSDATAMSTANSIAQPIQLNRIMHTTRMHDVYSKGMTCAVRFKKRIFSIGLLASLSAIYFRIQHLAHSISVGVWSCWKDHIALDQLKNIEKNDLCDELIREIQHMYVCSDNLHNYIAPLIKFFEAVALEHRALIAYEWWYTWCSRFYLTRLMPFKTLEITCIGERLERLSYVRTLVTCWITEHNIAACKKA